MRVLIIILTLTLICGSTSAQTLYPFQVLYAENARLKDGRELKSLDMVSVDESIKIENGGSLVLIHETGIPIEFNGDTTIMLSEIHAFLSPPASSEPSKSKYDNNYKRSVGLDYLFISQGAEARKFRLNRSSACHDCGPTYSIVYPPLINGRIYFDEDVKIIWQPKFSENEIAVKIVNVFDDELKSYVVKDSLVLISKDELNSENIDRIILFIDKQKKIRKKDTREGYFISHFYTDEIKFPYPSEIKTPAAALMAGYFFEMAYWQDSKKAQSYYELATRLSDKKFYQDMLANYYSRQGK